jgi:hypothetical protein
MIEIHCAECGVRLADSESETPEGTIFVCSSHVDTGKLPTGPAARREIVKERVTAIRALLAKHEVSSLSTRPIYVEPSAEG